MKTKTKPAIATLCFPIRAGGIFLAVKKHKVGAEKLNGYGGKCNDGETPRQAMAREFYEESGAHSCGPDNLENVAIIHFFCGNEKLFTCYVFLIHNWIGILNETEEMGEPQWYPIEDIPYEEMMPGDKEWLPIVLRGEKIIAHVNYNTEMSQASLTYTTETSLTGADIIADAQ